MPGFSVGGRRQFEPQHVAAAIETAAVENQHAVAVVNPRPRLGRRDQPPQHGGDALRIDRKIQPGKFIRRAVGFAGFQVEQPVGIDGDGIGFDGRGGGDGAGDDFGLHQKALRAGVDQAGAELRQIEDARHQRDQSGKIERNDAAGQAREGQREEKLSGPAQPAEQTLPTLGWTCVRAFSTEAASSSASGTHPRRSRLDQAGFDQAMAKTAGCFDCAVILPQTGRAVS